MGACGRGCVVWARCVLLVRVAWVNGEREREPVSVGSLSLSFFLLVERMAGVGPAASTVGGGALPVGLRPQCVPRLFACVCFLRVVRSRSLVLLVLGCGADGGGWARCLRLGGVAFYQIGFYPRVASPRFACGLLLLAWARGWRLYLPIDLAYECRRVVCVLSTPGVVISVT